MDNNSGDMSNLINNINSMLENGSIPDNIKNLLNNIKNNSSNSNNTSTNSSSSIDPNAIANMMKMFSNNNNSNSNSNNFSDNTSSNIDIDMILKLKSIMEKMNSNKNDPRSNLLLSLKPYLKESRKNKVEQYIQLFNITNIMNTLNMNGGEKTK